MPDRGSGLALLWSEDDVLLDHVDVKTRLCAHDLAVVDRSRPWSLKSPDAWTAHLLDFGARSFLLRVGRRKRELARPIDGHLPLALLIKRSWAIGREIDAIGVDVELIPQRLTDIIGTLCAIVLTHGGDRGLSDHKASTLERAELLIAAHLNEPSLSPATLAARMRISTRQLSSLFAATGTTTTQAILAQRLAFARSLLADPTNRHRQIAEIAIASSFPDPAYFTRRFRKHHGMTPKAFRDAQSIGLSGT